MNNTHTMIMASHTVSEKFRRTVRTLLWEILDEGVCLFFRVKAILEPIQPSTPFTPVHHRHLLLNR